MRRASLVAALVVCAAAPAAVFLGRYVEPGAAVAPAGSDTPQHLWRSEVVAGLGLEALPGYSGRVQALNANADRPGLPLLLAILSSVGGMEIRDLAYVLPGVAAAAIALAAAALAGTIPVVSPWGLAATGVVTGASVQVAMAANGYLDQLVVEVVLVGAAAAALRAAGGGPGRAAGAICLAGAWLVHWQFAAAFTALLVLVTVLTLPASVGRWRDGDGFTGTPAGRLGATLAGSAAGALALLATVPTPPRLPIGLGRSAIDRHLAKQVELYELPATGGAAAAGAALIGTGAGREGRLAAALLVPWALAPAAAAIAYDAGLVVPVQRAISAAVAIPILAGLALATIVALVARRGGRAAGALVALVLTVPVAGSAWLGWEAWRSRSPWSEDPRLAEFRALAAYLTAAGRPAIVVVDRAEPPSGDGALRNFGTVPVLRRLRAELPAALALDTRVYLGDPDRLLAGRPTLRPGEPGFDEVSRETWSAVRPLLERDPVVVVPRSQFARFAAEVADHRRWVATPWLAIVEGPPPPPGFDRPPAPRRPSPPTLAGWWTTTILAVAAAGAGWAIALTGGPIVLRLAVAPALGVALLVLVGSAAERLGIRAGAGVWAAVAVTGVAVGWLGARPRGAAAAPEPQVTGGRDR